MISQNKKHRHTQHTYIYIVSDPNTHKDNFWFTYHNPQFLAYPDLSNCFPILDSCRDISFKLLIISYVFHIQVHIYIYVCARLFTIDKTNRLYIHLLRKNSPETFKASHLTTTTFWPLRACLAMMEAKRPNKWPLASTHKVYRIKLVYRTYLQYVYSKTLPSQKWTCLKFSEKKRRSKNFQWGVEACLLSPQAFLLSHWLANGLNFFEPKINWKTSHRKMIGYLEINRRWLN
jgi:hypothetical protein